MHDWKVAFSLIEHSFVVVGEPEMSGRVEGDLFTCNFIFRLLFTILTPLGNFPKCLNCTLL